MCAERDLAGVGSGGEGVLAVCVVGVRVCRLRLVEVVVGMCKRVLVG